jgi:hypothetical protein
MTTMRTGRGEQVVLDLGEDPLDIDGGAARALLLQRGRARLREDEPAAAVLRRRLRARVCRAPRAAAARTLAPSRNQSKSASSFLWMLSGLCSTE